MNQQKILLIDYDPASIRRTATPLTKAGYLVEVAKDGVTGLAAFDEMHPDLVLVEAMLPKKHGFEVCQEIKAKADGASIPVLITTAVCRGRKYRMDALQIYGCDEYIEKPIADAELVEMIGRFLSAAAEAKEGVKQDLAAAIDAAQSTPPAVETPAPSADSPDAIESMSDDEIEAKIDALLLGEDPTDLPLAPEPQSDATDFATDGFVVADQEADQEADQQLEQAPPQLEPVEEITEKSEITETAEVASVDDEMERRVAAMVEATPEPAESIEPIEEEAASPEMEVAESAATVADATTTEAVEEWTETAAEPSSSGGSKKGLIAAAVVVLMLGAAAAFGWTQGWFGGAESGAEAADANPSGVQAASTAPIGLPTRPAPQEPTTLDEPAVSTVETKRAALKPQRQAEKASDPIQLEAVPAAAVQPKPRPKAQRQGPSKAEIAAAVERAAEAEQQMDEAAGSLQSTLLAAPSGETAPEIGSSTPSESIELDTDQLLAAAVPPPARRGDLVDIREVDTLPRPIEFEQPAYDELALRMRQQGTVIVEVLIDETGRVIDARILQEIPRSRLNDAAIRAARRWSYEPALKSGVAVKVWKSERIIFKL